MSRELPASSVAERLEEAKRLLLAAAAERSARIPGVRPPDPARVEAYREMIASYVAARGAPLFHPYLATGAGRGALVELGDGSVKYDMATGIGVHVLGHGTPRMLAAAIDAALAGTIMQGNLQQNVESARLVERLLAVAGESGARLRHCFLTSSGAMANENAAKIVFQARHPRDRLLAFEGCFMGRTLALSQVTDVAAYREGLPPTLAVDYVPFFDPEDPRGSGRRTLAALERHLARHPGRHAAMCFELVQGEGGFHVGDREFFLSLMERLREHGVAVLVDEVQTFGRTSRWFAFQHFGLDEYVDVVTIGKMTQACATLFTEGLRPRPGLVSQTFTAATAAIFAAHAVIDCLGDGFFGAEGRTAEIHRRFAERLRAISVRHPQWLPSTPAGFGIGGMIAFQVFGGELEPTKRFLHELFDDGVIAYYAGSRPTRVRFLPPLGAITDQDIDAVGDIVERALARLAPAGGPG